MGVWGNGGGYGRVRITCNGGDLSQTEIQYPVNSRHTPPCQTNSTKQRRIPLGCHHSSGLLIQTTTCWATVTDNSARGTCRAHEISKKILPFTSPLLAWESLMEVLTASVSEHILNLGAASFHISVPAASTAKACNLIKVISCLETTFLYSTWGNGYKRD